jgi:predicted O-methyltransferase YrrM
MVDDPRLKRNTYETPREGGIAPPPDSPEAHPVARILDARNGLILPTERMFLFGVLRALPHPVIRAVEIGTWRGTTMQMMRHACDELFCIDPIPQWRQDPSIRTRAGREVVFVEGRSPEALERIPGSFTFVFVDGDHSGQGVYGDAMALEHRMEPGGVICFHDGNHPPLRDGLFRAEREWRRSHQFLHLACDTIAQTPEGVYAGLSLIIVEPTAP